MNQKDIPEPRQSDRAWQLERTTWAFLLIIPLILVSLSPERQKQKHSAQQLAVYVKAGDSRGSGTILKPLPDGGIMVAITDHTLKSDLKEVCVKLPETTNGTTAYVLSRGDDRFDIAFLYLERVNIANVDEILRGPAPEEGDRIIAYGFSTTGNPIMRKGAILFRLQKGLLGSYDIATSVDIDKGMSGGPITNSAGHFTGIIATHSEPLWDSGLFFQDKKPVDRKLQILVDKSAMGISAKMIRARLAQVNLSLPDSKWRSKQCSLD